jgi:hypothetical protein
MKKKEKQPIESEMEQLLKDTNYTPLEEWKHNVQDSKDNSKDGIERDGEEPEVITWRLPI